MPATRRAAARARGATARVALLLAASAVPFPVAVAQDPSGAPDAPREEGSFDCEAAYRDLERGFRALPETFRGMGRDEATRLGAEVETRVRQGRRFLAECEDSARVPEVRFFFAKNLFLLSARYRSSLIQELRKRDGSFPSEELRARLAEYHEVVASHARKAFEALDEESDLRPLALQLLGRALSGAGDALGAREAFERFLELYPEHPKIGSAYTALARACLELERFDEGVRIAREGRRHPRVHSGPHYAYLEEALWKLYQGQGDLEAMLRVSRAVLRLYPLRLKDRSLSQWERQDYQRYLVFHGFRRPDAMFALGRFEEAKEAFRQYTAELGQQAEARSQEGGQLPPYARIYRQRGEDNLRFLEEIVGRKPPAGLELENLLWVTDRRLTLEAARGEAAVALVFRGVDDTRSRPFLELIDELCAGDPRLRTVAVHFLRSGSNTAQQLDQLDEELRSIGYRGAAGFDSDAQGKELFRAWQANVGSATFIAIDRQGRPVWFQEDPRDVHAAVAASILRRARDAREEEDGTDDAGDATTEKDAGGEDPDDATGGSPGDDDGAGSEDEDPEDAGDTAAG